MYASIEQQLQELKVASDALWARTLRAEQERQRCQLGPSEAARAWSLMGGALPMVLVGALTASASMLIVALLLR